MKVLFVNSHESDYLQDILYSGLLKTLGTENVLDWPFNKRYHLEKKDYPRNLGFNGGLHSFTRLFRRLDNFKFDLVVVGSCKTVCLENYKKIKAKIPKSIPIIFIDGGDRSELGGDLEREGASFRLKDVEADRPFDLIFKREYLKTDNFDKRVLPFPFAMNMAKIPPTEGFEKKYDVSFWAVESHPLRTQALELLQNHFDCKTNGTSKNQRFHHYKRKGRFYLEELARCKIVLNIRGAGWDTLRYWEVPAVGSLQISPNPGIRIPHDFENGKHIVHCREDLSDLIELCDYYLKNEAERERIAHAGHLHLLEHHTDEQRARQLLAAVAGQLN